MYYGESFDGNLQSIDDIAVLIEKLDKKLKFGNKYYGDFKRLKESYKKMIDRIVAIPVELEED